MDTTRGARMDGRTFVTAIAGQSATHRWTCATRLARIASKSARSRSPLQAISRTASRTLPAPCGGAREPYVRAHHWKLLRPSGGMSAVAMGRHEPASQETRETRNASSSRWAEWLQRSKFTAPLQFLLGSLVAHTHTPRPVMIRIASHGMTLMVVMVHPSVRTHSCIVFLFAQVNRADRPGPTRINPEDADGMAIFLVECNAPCGQHHAWNLHAILRPRPLDRSVHPFCLLEE